MFTVIVLYAMVTKSVHHSMERIFCCGDPLTWFFLANILLRGSANMVLSGEYFVAGFRLRGSFWRIFCCGDPLTWLFLANILLRGSANVVLSDFSTFIKH